MFECAGLRVYDDPPEPASQDLTRAPGGSGGSVALSAAPWPEDTALVIEKPSPSRPPAGYRRSLLRARRRARVVARAPSARHAVESEGATGVAWNDGAVLARNTTPTTITAKPSSAQADLHRATDEVLAVEPDAQDDAQDGIDDHHQRLGDGQRAVVQGGLGQHRAHESSHHHAVHRPVRQDRRHPVRGERVCRRFQERGQRGRTRSPKQWRTARRV